MSKLKALNENFNLSDKKVILRVDLNVPMQEGKVTDKSRINKIVPIIKSLINKKAKIILISHMGRPKGKIDKKLSLKPLSFILEKLIKSKVHFSEKNSGQIAKESTNKINNGEVLLLENLRFNKEEELNSVAFAKELSELGDIYINEAFSCSHRAHASVCEITKHVDSYAGKSLIEEINAIKMLTNSAKKPVVCIIGGSKISTKIGVLTNLIKKMETIVIVGAMANNFIKHKGYNIGNSLYEKGQENLLKNIIEQCKVNNCNLVIPEDVVVAKNNKDKGQLKNVSKIEDKDLILDIGEKTINEIYKVIDSAKTILWNGPAGLFETKEFSIGSNKIAQKINENTKNKSLISIAGGGDTVAAINKFGCSDGFTYISTAGGAFLELLEGKNLPGIKALEIND